MPRLPRINVEGSIYYITARSEHNKPLFCDEADYNTFIGLIRKYKKQFGFKLYAFVLLPTHLHLLIEPQGDATISEIMHSVNSLYTKRYNSRYQKKGHLFQSRFKSLLAEKELYILMLTRHIHNNPVAANVALAPQDYRYSSYAQYVARENYSPNGGFATPDLSAEIDEVLGYLRREKKWLGYEEYMKFAGTEKETAEADRKISRKRILGSPSFKARAEKEVELASVETKEVYTIPARTKAFAALFLVLVIATGGMYNYFYKRNASAEQKIAKVADDVSVRVNLLRTLQVTSRALAEEKAPHAVASRELKNSRWEIVLKPISDEHGSQAVSDTLDFKQRKFNSTYLASLGLPTSNYSVTEDGGVLIWETMQTASDGSIATWRGEWTGKKMKGMVSVKNSGGGSRKFSFTSRRGEFNEEI
ncbi:MAG: transposase [Candidatus Omnitrophota bacterium]